MAFNVGLDLGGFFPTSTTGNQTTGAVNGTKKSTDSGSVNTQTLLTGQQNTFGTTNNSGIQINSGRVDSGSSLQQNSGRTDTSTTGPSSSVTYNSGRVDTAQVLLTPDAINRLITQALQGSSGLAAVTSGQAASGGYDTTVNTFLTNDLLTRVAGDVAVRGAITETRIGASDSRTINSGSTTTNVMGASSSSSGSNNRIGESTVTNTSQSNSASQTNPFVNQVTQTVGPRTVIEDVHQDPVTNTTSTKTSKGLPGWIVCTELHRQGRLSTGLYRPGLAHFRSYDYDRLRGYYIWAIPAVKHLKADPNSWISNTLCSVFNARARYIYNERNKISSSVYEALCMWGVHFVCWSLARTVARWYNPNQAAYLVGHLETNDV